MPLLDTTTPAPQNARNSFIPHQILRSGERKSERCSAEPLGGGPATQWGRYAGYRNVPFFGFSKRIRTEVYVRRPAHVSIRVAVSVIAERMRGAVPTLAP